MPVRIAFRLTEPDEESDSVEWLLETVIVGDRGSHWTPAIRKKNSPAVEALPAKWKEYADDIMKKQSEMISFLQSIQIETSDRFLFVPIKDAQVRLFI